MDTQKLKVIELMQELARYKKQMRHLEKSVNYFMRATDDASLIIITLQDDLIKCLKKEIELLKANKQ